MKELDLSSTTESPSTLAATNKEVESSTSFEYQDNNLIRSPFQREIQRLLDSSASKVAIAGANKSAMNAIDAHISRTNTQNANIDINGGSSQSNVEFDAVLSGTNLSTVNGKHPVGLEAIKEIARNNTANTDSNQM